MGFLTDLAWFMAAVCVVCGVAAMFGPWLLLAVGHRQWPPRCQRCGHLPLSYVDAAIHDAITCPGLDDAKGARAEHPPVRALLTPAGPAVHAAARHDRRRGGIR